MFFIACYAFSLEINSTSVLGIPERHLTALKHGINDTIVQRDENKNKNWIQRLKERTVSCELGGVILGMVSESDTEMQELIALIIIKIRLYSLESDRSAK